MRHGRSWCATTSNYDVAKKWMYCNVIGTVGELWHLCFHGVKGMESIFKKKQASQSPAGNATPCIISSEGEVLAGGHMAWSFLWLVLVSLHGRCSLHGWMSIIGWTIGWHASLPYEVTQTLDAVGLAPTLLLFCKAGPDPYGDNPSCAFPFIYNGKSYSTCTGEGRLDRKPWCPDINNRNQTRLCNITGMRTVAKILVVDKEGGQWKLYCNSQRTVFYRYNDSPHIEWWYIKIII